MSSKQIAWAAVYGRKVTFVFVNAGHQVAGYVCGQDDFHWLVAVPEYSGSGITTTLVHKSSADLIHLSPDSTLDDEEVPIREAIANVGRGFWLFCEREYLPALPESDLPTQLENTAS